MPVHEIKPFTIVIFGASGDLTHRKLIPALYNNFRKKRRPAGLRIVGFARRDWSDDQFREELERGVKEHGTGFDPTAWQAFARSLRYCQGSLDDPKDFAKLAAALDEMETSPADRLYYTLNG